MLTILLLGTLSGVVQWILVPHFAGTVARMMCLAIEPLRSTDRMIPVVALVGTRSSMVLVAGAHRERVDRERRRDEQRRARLLAAGPAHRAGWTFRDPAPPRRPGASHECRLMRIRYAGCSVPGHVAPARSRPMILPPPLPPSTMGERPGIVRSLLLASGGAAAVLYLVTDLVAAMRWDGYRPHAQTVSELMAVGAPSRPLVVPLFLLHDGLLIAFAVGVWISERARSLRVVAALLIAIGLIGAVTAPWFPMHLRGVEATLTDTMHIAMTSVISALILVALGFGAAALGTAFRVYSIATAIVVVLSGVVAGLDGPRLAAGLPTPWIGLAERIAIYGCLLWLVVLAIALAGRANRSAPTPLR